MPAVLFITEVTLLLTIALQLDNDLQHFTAELQHAVAKQYGKGPAAEGDGSTGAWQLARCATITAALLC